MSVTQRFDAELCLPDAEQPVPTAILLISYGDQGSEEATNFSTLARQLADRLQQAVIPCPLDRPGNAVPDGIRSGLAVGAVKFVALPLLISPAEYRANDIANAFTHAARRWSFLTFHVAPLLDCWAWTELFSAAVQRHADDIATTSIILAHPVRTAEQFQLEAEADLAKLGYLLRHVSGARRVELAAVNDASLSTAVAHCQLHGQGPLVAIVTELFGGKSQRRLAQHSDAAGLAMAPPLCREPTLLDALAQQYAVALADDSLLPVSWDEVRREAEASNAAHRSQRAGDGTGTPGDDVQFQDLAGRIDAILPPRYQNGASVSAAPMAAAELQFDADGNVLWDQAWGGDDPDNPFCELALAGGPPHRGDLLEPVAAAECEAAPGKYAAVLAELARGIHLVAGLATVPSASPGWIGVQCQSDEMAIWLLRAIIVENVMVRREGPVLYLPAGPDFTIQGEMKNVVTVVAKTVHYWQEHVMSMASTVRRKYHGR